jgi:hypothetical protein
MKRAGHWTRSFKKSWSVDPLIQKELVNGPRSHGNELIIISLSWLFQLIELGAVIHLLTNLVSKFWKVFHKRFY